MRSIASTRCLGSRPIGEGSETNPALLQSCTSNVGAEGRATLLCLTQDLPRPQERKLLTLVAVEARICIIIIIIITGRQSCFVV